MPVLTDPSVSLSLPHPGPHPTGCVQHGVENLPFGLGSGLEPGFATVQPDVGPPLFIAERQPPRGLLRGHPQPRKQFGVPPGHDPNSVTSSLGAFWPRCSFEALVPLSVEVSLTRIRRGVNGFVSSCRPKRHHDGRNPSPILASLFGKLHYAEPA